MDAADPPTPVAVLLQRVPALYLSFLDGDRREAWRKGDLWRRGLPISAHDASGLGHRRCRRSSLFPPRPPSYPPGGGGGSGLGASGGHGAAAAAAAAAAGGGGGGGGASNAAGHRRFSSLSASHSGDRHQRHQRQRSSDGLALSGSAGRAVSSSSNSSSSGSSSSAHGINLLPAFAPSHTALATSWSLVLPPSSSSSSSSSASQDEHDDDGSAALRSLQDAGNYAVVGLWSGTVHEGGDGHGCDCGHVLLDEEILASWSVDKEQQGGGAAVGLDTVVCPRCHARFHPRLEVSCQALDPQLLARAFPEHAAPGAVRSLVTCLVLGASAAASPASASIQSPSSSSFKGSGSSSSSFMRPLSVPPLRSRIADLLHEMQAQRPKDKGEETGGAWLPSVTSLTEDYLGSSSTGGGGGPVREFDGHLCFFDGTVLVSLFPQCPKQTGAGHTAARIGLKQPEGKASTATPTDDGSSSSSSSSSSLSRRVEGFIQAIGGRTSRSGSGVSRARCVTCDGCSDGPWSSRTSTSHPLCCSTNRPHPAASSSGGGARAQMLPRHKPSRRL